MTTRSGRGRWERVIAARRQARAALGRDPETGDVYDAPPKRKTAPPEPPARTFVPSDPSESVTVLSLGEAAARLRMSRVPLKVLIDARKVEALPTDYTRDFG